MHLSKKKTSKLSHNRTLLRQGNHSHELKHILCALLPNSQNFAWDGLHPADTAILKAEMIPKLNSMNSARKSSPLCDRADKIISVRKTFRISVMIIHTLSRMKDTDENMSSGFTIITKAL
jgi:hypothetical protein